jgi:magnesium-transporting ATPase (P-type)
MGKKEEIKTSETDDVTKLKEDINELSKKNEHLYERYANLVAQHRRTRVRLFRHIFFTRFIIGSILIWSFFCLLFAGGAYAFLKEEPNNGLGWYVNDETLNVPLWGIGVIGWIMMLGLIAVFGCWYCSYYMDKDTEDGD